jgi:hypothetical protein|tara:strand:+ start:2239 stop:2883 length:645 start_codon:yes stop_codon:yes gene_type:complete
MAKLIVAGCSVSDYTNVKKVWGEYLAEQLNYEYVHEAAGCGSNYRMWRVLTTHILNGNITPDDTVIVQYTTLERNEFWSPIIEDDYLRDLQHDGNIIRFKSGSHTWAKGFEKKLMKLYERFINDDFEKEKFANNHMMFQCLAKEYKIKNLYFVKLGAYGLEDLLFLPQYKNNFFNYSNIFDKSENHITNDRYHLSDIGHKLLSTMIYNNIKEST